MRLYVEPMDTVVVEVDSDGRVRYEGLPGGDDEGWANPSLQERRAIIYAAQKELAELKELLDILDARR